jgi:membrane protease YdiL (CAAX protease family)
MSGEPTSEQPELPPRLLVGLTFARAFAWFYAWIFVQYAAFWLLEAWRTGASEDLITQGLVPLISTILLFFVMLRVHAPDGEVGAFVGLTPQRPWLIALAFLLGVAFTPLQAKIAWYSNAHTSLTALEAAKLDELFAIDTAKQRLLIVVFLVVLQPLTQELLFRGLLFERLRTRLSPIAAMVVVSGLLLVSYIGAPFQLACALPALVVLSSARLLTRSLWGSVACHLGISLVSYVPLVRFPEYDVPTTRYALVGAGVAVAACLGALLALSRRARPWCAPEPVAIAKVA